MIIAIKPGGGNREKILINQVEAEFLRYPSPHSNYDKIVYDPKEYNAYTEVWNHVNYEGIINHYITHHLMDKLSFSVEDLLQKGYQYNPRARILIDHINILNIIKGSEPSYVVDIMKFNCFSKVENEYIQHTFIGPEIILQQLEVLTLVTIEDGRILLADLGRKLLWAKNIPLPPPQKKEEVIGTCKYCLKPTNLRVCIPCRVEHNDMTMYEKSNRF
ncbi:hypothetical protein [Neobacillus sp. OS1-33]|uniref:hypothetical protein n=1 Tax=Neobacillus sp. OS1-33 TaxID=3070683 RepID=UPI0027E19DDE|nr:hypothetical protein [Neobacillus sp. OS1-33]WML24118.1 hypothetical protein RCG22_14245 [Neobacillus sp. OS1-33]